MSSRNKSFLKLAAASSAAAALAWCGPLQAASYSTGFEDFTVGPLSPTITTAQNGWSGGAQGGLTNNDPGDEQIVNTVAHTGDQSWHYARGYNSPGQGTAFTPNVDPLANLGDSMTGTVWFKAHTGGDNSLLAIETGNLVGDDRAEIVAYVDNVPGGLTVRSFTGSAFAPVAIAADLDNTLWHELDFTLTRTTTGHTVSVSVDGGTPAIFDGSLADWRTANSFGYTESSRLKFRPRHADGDPSFNGFYLDDVSYAVVPEPTGLALIGLGAVALLARRRRRATA